MAKRPVQMTNLEARKMIDKDTAAYLKSGKKIQQIPQGVSGQDALASRKQLVIPPKQKGTKS